MPGKYIIKEYQWGYNDETFYTEGGALHSMYTTESEAHSATIQLERVHWKRMDLHETHVLFNGDNAVLAKLKSLVKHKLGKDFDIESGNRGSYVPQELSDEDFLHFLDIADLRAYKIIETEDEPVFWAIWLSEDEEYLRAGEHEGLIFSESIDELKAELSEDPWALTYIAEESEALTGSLESLSKTPRILQELIATSEAISYDESANALFIDEDDIDAHFAVNELLTNPLFEVRKLHPEQIQALQ